MRVPYVPNLVARLAPQIGARVELEPEFGFAGRIIFADGSSHVFKANNLNVNRGGSIAIADDKHYTGHFLRAAGFRVPREITVFAPKLRSKLAAAKARTPDDACTFAAEVGYPVIVKPNDGSLGELITKAYGPNEVTEACAQVFADYQVALVQEFVAGNDYRIVVLGDEVISAYQRTALRVIGDGRASIDELLRAKKQALPDQHRPNSEIDLVDVRIDAVLARAGLDRSSILPAGVTQPLLDNANLSTGGDAVDITDRLAPGLGALAIRAAKTIGLNLCGVDIICADATKSVGDCVVLELNGAPGLDNYASVGEVQRQRVEMMYLRILRFLEANAATGS